MRVGTKSLLIGVHQVVWHPITVALAWRELYGRWPGWREAVCIVVHDWGYVGKAAMDDAEGETHPELGAAIAGRLFGAEYRRLVLLHSRHYARRLGCEPSALCWADKLSLLYEPRWWYLLRARLSGELAEYRRHAAAAEAVAASASDREWWAFMREHFERQGREQRTVLLRREVGHE